ncbi:hypothetical protein TNCV_4227481 [Trichonephila clavipes]|nr:hypothetical protein TNCV_4227481 [Trichonephila clavipes]
MRKADKECHKHRLRAQQSNMHPDLRKHICEHIIRVLQHQKDVNQKQHNCIKHDFVIPSNLACAYLKGHLRGRTLDWFEIFFSAGDSYRLGAIKGGVNGTFPSSTE